MKSIFLLILVTSIWGLGFVGTRWTFIDYSPIWSNSLRFVFAGLICLPYLVYKNALKDLKAPLICSSILMIGLQLQTIGIGHTTLAKSGFLTVFYAIFTPLLSYFFLKVKFRRPYWILVATAMMGISMLCNLQFSQFNYGDFMNLASALFFSIHILAVDKYAKNVDAAVFNFQQCIFMGAFGLAFALAVEGPVSLNPLTDIASILGPSSLLGFLILSVFSSLIAFTFQVQAQKKIAPHIVSLVFLLESIFASIFGYLFFNEKLNFTQLAGCGLVLLSVALIPRLTSYKKKAAKQAA